MPPRRLGPSTQAVHGGEPRVRDGRSITAPVVLSSTYPFDDTAELSSYMEGRLERAPEYGRYGNPTVAAAEAKLAALEGGEAAVLLASGMAAITTTCFAMLRQGAHAVFTADVYRKTRAFATDTLSRFGVEVDVVAPTASAIEAALRPTTKLLFTELPTNPYLRVVDLPAVVACARAHRVKTIVDATFATPVNLQPLALGADLVIHSTTKYLAGHNDLLGGVVIGKRGIIDAIREQLGTLGGIADPLSAFLLLRGVKTLALRLARQNASALALAEALERHPKVRQVWYPLLASHPDHAVAVRDLQGGGAVVSFEVHGGLAAGTALVDAVRIPKLAPSLGGVESLIEQPALMSHYELAPEQRAAIGIREGLVRLSVGIEDLGDLHDDLLQALDRV
ncbi:MAG: aminotransferase class I/II-fold pyridoxal phosphate-dependent enzyme [Deltaproteobacteria bacterium]|nr:aminotransferase class I/II-fold pyridoxal phosphate-dependent enzyme [Deltaproteobacteria bacterium]MBK8717556.1 aminotransferase class I/II-fold pyridoxal phosphate-dependent enzyme [Deltaproteobacteria bacterium]MBP7285836.1 aminotransferase class I/II-fold pyridoxal phosphate-dependent enzyme [Nannocystaceae bacterium]